MLNFNNVDANNPTMCSANKSLNQTIASRVGGTKNLVIFIANQIRQGSFQADTLTNPFGSVLALPFWSKIRAHGGGLHN